MSRVNHDSEAQTAYFHLHLVAPKLFPAWGTRHNAAAPVSPKWAQLDSKNGWAALPAVSQLVSVAGLSWGYDSECLSVSVQDGVNEFTVEVGKEVQWDVRVALMAALRLMIVRRPELSDPDSWASYDHPPLPRIYARPVSDFLPTAEMLNAWGHLCQLAPKLFPQWGAVDDAALLRVNWVELNGLNADRAVMEVLTILRRLRLGWAWDTQARELAVKDAQVSYGHHGTLPRDADPPVVLLEALGDLLTEWPELGNPDLWTDGTPPRRPEIVHGWQGLTMDGELILPAEVQNDPKEPLN